MHATIGNYELCEEIGRGHTDRVYRAIHKPTSKIVAVKVISNSGLRGKNGRKHHYSEREFYCRLKHDNIVHFYDFFSEADCDFLVMEYIDGFNLRQCIKGCSVPIADHNAHFNHLVDTARKICEGLMYLHNQKTVHGHIKPENILVSREVIRPDQIHKQVKVSDFALAESVRGFFRPSAHVKGGTLKYMSPEQVTQKRATFQSDIFSLGITLYELFTGQHPWGRSSSQKQLLAELLSPKRHPRPPSRLASSLPRQLDAAIMKMIEKDEKKRHATMAEVWLDLSNMETVKI